MVVDLFSGNDDSEYIDTGIVWLVQHVYRTAAMECTCITYVTRCATARFCTRAVVGGCLDGDVDSEYIATGVVLTHSTCMCIRIIYIELLLRNVHVLPMLLRCATARLCTRAVK